MIIDKGERSPTRLTVEEEYPIFFTRPRPEHVDKLLKEREERKSKSGSTGQ